MKRKYLFIIVLIFILASCGALCRSLYDTDKTLIIGKLPEPGEAITSFFDDLSEKKFDSAVKYIENYDSLGFETPSSDSLIELYKQKIVESYTINFSGEIQTDGLYASQMVDITFLDSRKILDEVSKTAPENALDYMYEGNVIETDEQAKSFVYDAISVCLENPELYYSTETAEIKLKYNNGGWQIIADDSLLNILFGYIQSISTEGNK